MTIGIIGGTGVYDPKLLEQAEQIKIHTPYGATSDSVTVGIFKGVKVAILARHGQGHMINPSNINYRANIWALKSLGVSAILAPSAVGSLKEEIKPGNFVFTDQFIDRTFLRKNTFYEGQQVCHISVAEPCCGFLRGILAEEANKLGFSFHGKGTCVVIEGPRFSTKAESAVYRSWGAEIIGMTMCPEAVLARETEICYATIAMVTDYDVWRESHVSFEEIIKTMKENDEKVKKLLEVVIPRISKQRSCKCREALRGALS